MEKSILFQVTKIIFLTNTNMFSVKYLGYMRIIFSSCKRCLYFRTYIMMIFKKKNTVTCFSNDIVQFLAQVVLYPKYGIVY